jgi:outer membrane receptor protein involved in Fe transport
MRIASFVLLAVLVLVSPVAEAGQSTISGVVKDQVGGVVSGASVIARSDAGVERQAVTGPDGRFSIPSPGGTVTLVVRASGFAEKQQPASGAETEITVDVASVLETVTVTPTRTEQRTRDIPASVVIVEKDAIRESPAVVADDVLRQVPTFSLFRRSSSIGSHPTTQGVSLRGIGPSGVSRALVLIDGVPFNDPFGGWVYWTRVPLETVDRIEVVEGNSSNVYGNYAMGGVLNFASARPKPKTFEFRTQYGNLSSPKADFFASNVWGRVGASIEGSAFSTDGYPNVIENERGRVDQTPDGEWAAVNVDYRTFNLKVDYRPTDRVNLFLRGGYFDENRLNGKYSTFDGAPEENDTVWSSVSGGLRATLPDQSDLQARVFGDFEKFRSSFLAVPNLVTRAIGRTTLRQKVPTTGVGAMVQWSKAVSTRQMYSAGVDFRHVDGASEEIAYDIVTGLTPTVNRESGGTQMSSGAFVQGQFWPATKVTLTLSGRLDHWRNYNGRNLEYSAATGLPTANHRESLPDKSDTVFTPRAAVRYHLSDTVSTWASIGWGFRAPTLNELYRQFRVGAILTLANEQLGPEHLVGGEIGINLEPTRNLSLRGLWFDNRVDDPVANVTRTDLVNTQQRQNLGSTHIWGLQTDAEYRIRQQWRVGASYMFNQATVTEFAANPALVGKYLPQVPAHRGSVHAAYANPRLLDVALSVLFSSRQYNDDLNVQTKPGETEPGLPAYGVVDLTALRAIGRNVDVFFGVQNMFNTEYYVGLAPTTIGSPRMYNGGIRVRFSGQ